MKESAMPHYNRGMEREREAAAEAFHRAKERFMALGCYPTSREVNEVMTTDGVYALVDTLQEV